jgi:hypothetical protein
MGTIKSQGMDNKGVSSGDSVECVDEEEDD